MNTKPSIPGPPRRSREGSAIMIILVLLGLMVVLMAANTATLNRLRQRVKLVEQRQMQRLGTAPTNSAPALRQNQTRP